MASSKTPSARARRVTTKSVPLSPANVTPVSPKPAAALEPAGLKSARIAPSAMSDSGVTGGIVQDGARAVAASSVQTGAKGGAQPAASTPDRKAGKVIVGKTAIEKKTPAVRAAKPPVKKMALQVIEKGKEKREKVVRDSFSMPKTEHAGLKTLRTELARAGRICTKSELLRAGLRLVSGRSIESLVKLLDSLPVVPKGKSAKK